MELSVQKKKWIPIKATVDKIGEEERLKHNWFSDVGFDNKDNYGL